MNQKTFLNSSFHAFFETSLDFLLYFVTLLYPFNSFYMTLKNKAGRNFETMHSTAADPFTQNSSTY